MTPSYAVWWTLEGHTPKICTDVKEWARWFEKADRKVAATTLGESFISTVFLGLDHQYINGPPLLFETLVFGGPFDGETDRYSTWEEAEKGHEDMVRRVMEGKPDGTNSN